MSDTSLQTAPKAAPPAADPLLTDAAQPKAQPRGNRWLLPIEIVGSLRITVTLFAMSLVLVFFGTLAQIDGGIWTVMRDYFRSVVAWLPLQLLVKFGQIFFGLPKDWTFPGAIPFPGGAAIGSALLLNLVCAYSLRVPGYMKRWKNYVVMSAVLGLNCLLGYLAVVYLDQWQSLAAMAAIVVVTAAALVPFHKLIFFPGNRIGIFTLHIGLVLMIAGEFFAYTAIEGNMIIEEGENTNAVVHNRHSELAVIEPSGEEHQVTVVPGGMLQRTGRRVSHEELPFDITVVKWMVNSDVRELDPNSDTNLATAGTGLKHIASEHRETAGAATKQTVDTPSAYVTLTDKQGNELGTYLVSILLPAQKVKVGEKQYDVALRFKMSYKPYSLELKKFTFARYPGTETPKDFASDIVLRDPERGDDRELTIRMNSPLRHRGDTLFQASWNEKTERGTVLQVVQNPGWQLPYWSCAIVTLGMLMHFGLNLINFLARRAGE